MNQDVKNGLARQVLVPITRTGGASQPRAGKVDLNIGSHDARVDNRKTLGL
jgi:hypothetical protein